MQEITITEANEGQRLNKFLGKYFDNAPQSFIYKMLRKKNIKWNNGKATGNEILKAGDSIKIFMTDETISNFRKDGCVPTFANVIKDCDKGYGEMSDFKNHIPFNIIYEDRDILILNKPTDVLSQKAKITDYSLNEQIVDYYCKRDDVDKLFTPSVCNRLDRNTSGIIIAGMSLKGSRCISAMLKERVIDKYYLTVVSGKITNPNRIKGYLAKQTSHNRVKIYDTEEEAKKDGGNKISYIETGYEPIAHGKYKDKDFTLLKVKLITGKSHQIRAHLFSIGYPIIGDGKYGDNHLNQIMKKDFKLRHQLLHAYCLKFPDHVMDLEKNLCGSFVKAEPPKEFLNILQGIFHIDSESLNGLC